LTPRATGAGGGAAAVLGAVGAIGAGGAVGPVGPVGTVGPVGPVGPAGARGQGGAPLAALAMPVGQLAPDPDQPRRRFSEERLAWLAASVRACGVIHPLLVVPHPEAAARAATPYQILVGERRWLAARRAGLATVPVVVREERLAPADRLMLQIAESDGEHREELALFDLAGAVGRAFEMARCSQALFAQRHRRSQAWVSNLLRIAHAEGVAREALQEGLLQGVLAALTFLRLTAGQQRHLLAEARETRLPIGLRRAEKAAAETEDRRRRRGRAAGDGAEGGAEGAGGADGRDGALGAKGGAGGAGGRGGGGGAAVASGPWGREARASRDGGTAAGGLAAGGAVAGGLRAGGLLAGGLPAGALAAGALCAERADGAGAAGLGSGAGPADFAAARARSATAGRFAGTGSGSTAAELRTPAGAGARATASFRVGAVPGSCPGGPRISFEITVAQLETLLIRLGQEPAGSARDMAEQLLACL
jgi:ParB family transcriptional regulator, chromosome partitioning protein